jgi:LAS superfamily LD-carboxypeptidase LdcB
MDTPKQARATQIALIALALLVAGGSVFGYVRFMILEEKVAALTNNTAQLEEKLASTTALLRQNIDDARFEFASELEEERGNIEQKLGNVEETVGSISGTVSTLEKLSKTDPELLAKYSRVYFLNEHYTPERLVQLPDEYEYDEDRSHQIHASVWPYLRDMLSRAANDGVDIYVFSAFRSFNEQSALKGQYTVSYGAGTANQFSADQGYSEHQLGTTVDLITTGIGGTLSGFNNTEAYQWLLENAHRYGFILSYPDGNEHYVFEPWHWRFVGVRLATDLYNSKKGFYDLDQREIDEYLVYLFE